MQQCCSSVTSLNSYPGIHVFILNTETILNKIFVIFFNHSRQSYQHCTQLNESFLLPYSLPSNMYYELQEESLKMDKNNLSLNLII